MSVLDITDLDVSKGNYLNYMTIIAADEKRNNCQEGVVIDIDIREQIISDYLKGVTCSEICKKYDISWGYLFQNLKKWNVKLRGHVKPSRYRDDLDKDIDKIIKLYKNGMSLNELARIYSTHRGCITKRLKSCGITVKTIRHSEDISEDLTFKINAEYIKGVGIKELSEKYNLSREGIRIAIIKSGGESYRGFKNKKRYINNIDVPWLGYIAGIIDGEGCFYTLIKKTTSGGKRITAGLKITQTNFELIKSLHSIIGAGYYNEHKRFENKNQRPALSLILEGYALYQLTEILLPYLILKKKHAELILELKKLHWKGTNIPYNFERQLEIRNEIRKLNKRGIN